MHFRREPATKKGSLETSLREPRSACADFFRGGTSAPHIFSSSVFQIASTIIHYSILTIPCSFRFAQIRFAHFFVL